MALAQEYRDRHLFGAIGDEDSITGLLLAGIGQCDSKGEKNFLTVDSKTTNSTIEATFRSFTERSDIAIILINQHIAERIRDLVDGYTLPFPAILEIPSKDHKFDPSKDSVLLRVRKLFGE